MRSFRHSLRYHFDQFRMGVSLDQGAERHHEINVFASVGVPDMRSAAAFEEDRTGFINSGTSGGGIHAFDQRLLSAVEQLLRAHMGTGCGGL